MILQAIVQQAMQPETGRRLADLVQYLTGAGVVALAGFCWKMNGQITRILTILTEPEMGIVPRVQGIGKQGHSHSGKLQEHEMRLDGHDKDIERLGDRRAITPDGQPYDRRRTHT